MHRFDDKLPDMKLPDMRHAFRLVLLTLLVILVPATQGQADTYRSLEKSQDQGQSRVALVIGNAAYAECPLQNPANDAGDMAAVLAKCGFSVLQGQNMNRREMREAVRAFSKQLQGADVGLFFYAGHGLQVDGLNYLVPIGADVAEEFEVDDQCLEANYVLDAMEQSDARLNIVILDACRNDPFRRFRSKSGGLAYMRAPSGSFVAFSTAPGGVASDGPDGRNGLFTASLLKHLPTPGLRLTDVFINVGNDVFKKTKGAQEPWVNHSIRGAFFFVADGLPPDAGGTLEVETEPPGASVLLDNAVRGQTPQTLPDVPAGQHTVRVELQGYQPQERVLRMETGRKKRLRLVLDAAAPAVSRLRVDASPADASVTFLNSVQPYSPGMELEPGQYRIRVEKRGYEPVEQNLTLREDEDLSFPVQLEQIKTRKNERVRRFLTTWLAAWNTGDVTREMQCYAPSVNFYGKPYSPKNIRKEKEYFYKRWAVRDYTISGDIACRGDCREAPFTVEYNVRFTALAPARGKCVTGETKRHFVLQNGPGPEGLQISDESEKILWKKNGKIRNGQCITGR